MPALSTRRLPGFAFEAVSPPLDEALPRMDVAVFVGFAASGPIDVPVPIEQSSEFAGIFGGDVRLAWDLGRGAAASAHLGPTVRAFFRNGGRRCWVIRIAGEDAAANVFPLPGLLAWSKDSPVLGPAAAVARSEGSWSDGLEAATLTDRQPLVVTAMAIHRSGGLTVGVGSPADLTIGDLLRLTFREDGYRAFGAIQEIRVDASGAARLELDPVLWVKEPRGLAKKAGTAEFEQVRGQSRSRPAVTEAVGVTPGQPLVTTLTLEAGDDIRPGLVLRIPLDDGIYFLAVTDVAPLPAEGSNVKVRARGPGVAHVIGTPIITAALPKPVDRLRLDLLVRQGSHEPVRLERLGLAAAHPRFWAALKTDRDFFAPLAEPAAAALPTELRGPFVARFPLAGTAAVPADSLCIPIGDLAEPQFLPPLRAIAGAALRDGLATFDPGQFIDVRLRNTGTNALLGQAEAIRYQSAREPQRLRGMHAAFFIEEATLISAPDAVHRRWREAADTQFDAPPPVPPEAVAAPECPHAGPFDGCSPGTLEPPVLKSWPPASGGHITLEWTGTGAATRFTLEEAPVPGFTPWVEVATTSQRTFTVYDRPPGEYAFRVRARAGARVSAASNGVVARIDARRHAVMEDVPTSGYDDRGLLDVHRALLRMCAARGDMVAVLGLPEHYRDADTLAYARDLASGSTHVRRGDEPPLGAGEAPALSYGALYHPWLIVSDGDGAALRRVPPDGAVTGALAARAIARGAWVAPANELLRGVVALTPALHKDARSRLALLTAQVNEVRQEAAGFVVLNADTLSPDHDLRLLNVRRLLILIRRRALQIGAQYVFEPNDDGLRRLVQRGFEEMLGRLYERGAFAGHIARAAFQVVTDESLNTPQSRDAGRFFVDLRVAPSWPLTFLTVRLLQRGERLTASEGR